AIASDSREANDMSSRLAATTSRSSRAGIAFAERTAFSERLSSAHEHGETISIDMAQDPHNLAMFLRYAEQYGGDSAAAFAMFDAELARQGLRPNRVFSDGTALPASFNDIHEKFDQTSDDSRVNPDIDAMDRQHHARASRFNTPMPMQTIPSEPSLLRSDIQAKGESIRDQTAADRSAFDSSAQIVKTPDGTLASKKSLLLEAGKQVARDGGATFDNTLDIAKAMQQKRQKRNRSHK
ncbi:MAG TPA: conjugal transfer protein TraG, partial [Janthinobacterium sp.]|nr:conjugal transfer protein TraG [Janthinobacterium sp.]